jgi:hypothetical protein
MTDDPEITVEITILDNNGQPQPARITLTATKFRTLVEWAKERHISLSEALQAHST